jgi:hypothetical protein
MDFIERIFGISPDRGSGALEVVIFCVLLGASVLAYRRIRARRRL